MVFSPRGTKLGGQGFLAPTSLRSPGPRDLPSCLRAYEREEGRPAAPACLCHLRQWM